jgi:hypothetical protein
MECSNRVRRAALSDDFACAPLALAALSGNTEFELNFVECHARSHVACDFTVGDSAAYANDHGL